MKRALLLGAWLCLPMFAISLPPCPAGAKRFDKNENGMSVAYCAKPVLLCPATDSVEHVTYQKNGRVFCALADGPVLYKNRDASTVLMRYRLGVLDGTTTGYSTSGKKILEEEYRAGVKAGLRMEWHYLTGNRKLSETYTKGLRHGLVVVWYPSGKLKSKQMFQHGKREGKFEEWYENGATRAQASFANGVWFGPYGEWYSTGKKFSESYYKEGMLDGRVVMYYPNGSKASEQEYHAGKREGVFAEWDEQGRKIAVSVYKGGKLQKVAFDERPTRGGRLLASLPLAPDILAKCAAAGVSTSQHCFKVDLDGNGHPDYVISSPQSPTQTNIYLMRGSHVAKELTLNESSVELYTARFQEGQFGEPISPRDGLVVWGKGGNTRVYLYDFDKEIFKKTVHASDSY